jgi:hypothetical protein
MLYVVWHVKLGLLLHGVDHIKYILLNDFSRDILRVLCSFLLFIHTKHRPDTLGRRTEGDLLKDENYCMIAFCYHLD